MAAANGDGADLNTETLAVHRSCYVGECIASCGEVICCIMQGSFCGMEAETVQRIICCCKALARQRYNVFGRLTVEPKDISTASVKDLCLFIRGAGLVKLC